MHGTLTTVCSYRCGDCVFRAIINSYLSDGEKRALSSCGRLVIKRGKRGKKGVNSEPGWAVLVKEKGEHYAFSRIQTWNCVPQRDWPDGGRIATGLTGTHPGQRRRARHPFYILDDIGYAKLSAFGGLVNIPNLDRLAENGSRYTTTHTTALCSPKRSCVLTGRNHHSNGVA
jgi:hypothetical protein